MSRLVVSKIIDSYELIVHMLWQKFYIMLCYYEGHRERHNQILFYQPALKFWDNKV